MKLKQRHLKKQFSLSDIFTRMEKEKNMTIFSDIKSVLEALENNDSKDKDKPTRTIGDVIASHGINITLQWIPGYTNIQGNERGDTLAKQGARCMQQNYTTSTTLPWLLENKTDIFNHMTIPNSRDSLKLLRREEQVTIFRLRSEHAPLNAHLKRIGAIADSGCLLCPEETVAHHLFVCRQLNDLRTEYLRQNPDIANTLYANPEQLRSTHKYLIMVSGKRARAQWLLDRVKNKYSRHFDAMSSCVRISP